MLVYIGPSVEAGFSVSMHYQAQDGKRGAVKVSVEFLQDVLGARGDYEAIAKQASSMIGDIASSKYRGEFPVLVTSQDRSV